MTYSIRNVRRTDWYDGHFAEYQFDFYKDGEKINEWYFEAPAPAPALRDLRAALEKMKNVDLSFYCMDCGVHTGEANEYYTVRDEVWLLANPADSGMLCIGCLEERLGRTLTASDFPDYPVNIDFGNKSARLKERLGYEALEA